MKSTYLAGAGLLATGLFAGAVAFAPQTNAISLTDIGYDGSNVSRTLSDGVYNLTLTGDAVQDVVVGADETAVLDLNGHTLTNYWHSAPAIEVKAGGTLTIKDSATGGTITKVQGHDGNSDTSAALNGTIINNGTLNIESGNFTEAAASYGVVTNTGTLKITGGTFTTALSYDLVRNEGQATISGGTFTSTSDTEIIDNTCNANSCGTLDITGGVFSSTAWNLVSFNTDGWDIPENAKAVTTISGGTWTASDANKTMIIVDGSEVAVKGGTYNYSPKALAEGYSAYPQSSVYKVAESIKISSTTDSAIASLIEKVAAGETVSGVDAETANNIISAAIEGKTISARAIKASKTAEAVTSAEADLIADAADGLTLGDYYDVGYFIFANDETIGGATELEAATELRFAASTELLSVPTGYTRTYKVIRIHNGAAAVLDAELDGDEIVTSSDKFSTYVIAYYDVAVTADTTTEDEATTEEEATTTENPNTSTGTVLLIALIAIGAVSLFGLIKGLKWTA